MIENAYKDLQNDGPSANIATCHDNISGLIHDSAHVTSEITSLDTDLPDAPTLCEALAGLECDSWHAVVLEELATIKNAGTWVLVNCTPHIWNIISCQFILQKKHGVDGRVMHFKAHLVMQHFSQQESIDYSETFALVVKFASLRIFLAICAQCGWHVRQMDIKSAYLNGVLSKDIYMCQPKGYEEKGSKDKVTKLQKGLYGLKQAGHEWYATLHDFLFHLSLCWTHTDHSVFVFK